MVSLFALANSLACLFLGSQSLSIPVRSRPRRPGLAPPPGDGPQGGIADEARLRGEAHGDGPRLQHRGGELGPDADLQALLEPTSSGERLRLKTLKGSARTYQTIGAAFMGITGLLGVAELFGRAGDPWDLFLLGVIGAAFFVGGRLTVPTWARTRSDQFEDVISRLQRRLTSPPTRTDGGVTTLGS